MNRCYFPASLLLCEKVSPLAVSGEMLPSKKLSVDLNSVLGDVQ